jgi:two-component system chemotaxis response regulator CheB
MPVMDGLACLDRIMIEWPCPVVMVSALTAEAADATLEALHLGAVDFIARPGGAISLNIPEMAPLLVRTVRAAAGARPRPSLRLKEKVRHRMGGAMAQPRRRAAGVGTAERPDRGTAWC